MYMEGVSFKGWKEKFTKFYSIVTKVATDFLIVL